VEGVRNTLNFSWDVPAARAAPFGIPLALLCGALMGFTHIPFALSVLTALPLAGLLYLSAREATPRLAARVAFWGWLAFWGVHLFWLPQSFSDLFRTEGGWGASLAVWVLMPLVWIIEAGFNALLTWVAHRVTKTPIGFLGFMAGGLVLLEWARGLGPLAFPWGNFGYALIGSPLAQISSLGGVLLGSLLITLLASSLAALAWFEWRWPIASGVLVIAALGYGLTRPAPPIATKNAWLAQGNIDVLRRFRGTNKSDLQIYSGLVKKAPRDALIVLPEAALDLGVVAQLEAFPLPAARRLPSVPRLISGVADGRQGARLNAVAAVSNSALLGTTNKTHLVPFGEYYPLRREASFVYDFVFRAMGLGSIGSSEPSREQRVLPLSGERFGAFVCYDSIFASLPRSLVTRGAQVLVETTNDGWFGGGSGNAQHFAMDQIRAIETGRYLLRVANTGITAGIDPQGRVLGRLPQNVEAGLLTRYAAIDAITPYVLLGDWVLWLAFALSAFSTVSTRENVRW
jgi:apolipoprotein N-acyltransferase